MQGERRGPRKGRSVELSDFRPYAEGDDPRQIDWRAYARMERLFIKLFVVEEDTTLHLLLDRSQSMAWGAPPKLWLAKQLAAAMGYVALGRQEWVSTVSFAAGGTGRPEPVRGRDGLPRLLSSLAALGAEGGTDSKRALVEYAAAARRPGPLLLFSDLYGEGWHAGIDALLAAGFEPSVIHILDPEELRPTLAGDLRLRDDETGEHVPVTIDEGVLRTYRAALAEWRDGWADFCAGRGVTFVPLDSTLGVEDILFGIFRMRGLVG
jgi:uncharacterized protein (DUF58 family)